MFRRKKKQAQFAEVLEAIDRLNLRLNSVEGFLSDLSSAGAQEPNVITIRIPTTAEVSAPSSKVGTDQKN